MKTIIAVTVFAALAASARADIFSDNFDTENGGVGITNYNGLTNWTVTNGTIDLIGNGYFDFLPGNGLYIDLDGSSFDAGDMMSMNIFLSPGSYTLYYDLAGSQRSASPVDAVNVTFGTAPTVNHTGLNYTDGFATYSINMTVTIAGNYTILFQDLGTDNQGALLDNVRVVPTPGAAALLGAGLLASGRRRRV